MQEITSLVPSLEASMGERIVFFQKLNSFVCRESAEIQAFKHSFDFGVDSLAQSSTIASDTQPTCNQEGHGVGVNWESILNFLGN